jgi:cytoskeletal protein CcmA (bactofilin family)
MWNRESSVKSEHPKDPQVGRPVSPALPAEERRVVAWVGKSVVFKGTLNSSEDMTIDGHVEGTIEARDHGLTIGPNADIRADIVAKIVTVHGTVVGNIRASAKVDIRETGRIDGDVLAARVVIADGAVIRGRVDTLGEQADRTKQRAQLAVV